MATLRQRVPIDVVSGESPSDDETIPIFTPPDFTVKDLLSAIPKHCFERSALHSSAYLVVDVALVGAIFYAGSWIETAFGKSGTLLQGQEGIVAKWAAWSVYWFAQGLAMTGLWVVAHECGHQAFSTSKALNNGLGLFIHSLLFVPYHSWRVSHARHHAGTGHIDRDEVFVPRTLKVLGAKPGGTGKKIVKAGVVLDELLEDVPIYRLFELLIQQLLGWPLYLIKNASGQLWYPEWTSHFNPSALIFDKRHRQQVLISDAALIAVAGLLYAVKLQIGGAALAKYYFVPYLCVNHWLVMITYLQHTDPIIPHYKAGEWTFPRGALSTMDRNLLGPIGPYILHGICETHVAHHINSKIPHYHAWEATEALKELLGPHYLVSNDNMFYSLWQSFRRCRFVAEDEPVIFYRDAYGRVSRRAVLTEKMVDSGVDVEEAEEIIE